MQQAKQETPQQDSLKVGPFKNHRGGKLCPHSSTRQRQSHSYTNTHTLSFFLSFPAQQKQPLPSVKTMAPRLVHLTLALGAMFLCLPGSAAVKDTVKNRMKMADRYMDENPVEEGMEAMARYVRVGLWFCGSCGMGGSLMTNACRKEMMRVTCFLADLVVAGDPTRNKSRLGRMYGTASAHP